MTAMTVADEGVPGASPIMLGLRIPILRLALAAFLIFGLCLIVNGQVTSDGTWYLYAKLLRRGVRLYSDLQLPQQPLFFLITAWWQAVTRDSWLLSLLPSALNLVLFAYGYFTLANRSDWPEWQKAIVFLGSASVAIAWNSYHFGDYRVLTDIIYLYAIVLLLRMQSHTAEEMPTLWPILLGIFAGLSFTTRANDGLLLLFSLSTILVFWYPGQRVRLLILVLAGFALSAFAVLLLTGDSLAAYVDYTLLRSPQSKGGVQQVALSPLMLVGDLARFFLSPIVLLNETLFLLAAALPMLVARRLREASSSVWKVVGVLALLLFESSIIAVFYQLSFDCAANVILPILMVALLIAAAAACLSGLGILRLDKKAALFLVPAGALIAGGMSSGGQHLGLNGPVGLFLVILPLVFSLRRPVPWLRSYALAIYSLLAAAIIVGKVVYPLAWQNYLAKPMFVDRTMINHPRYGPIVVEKGMDSFFRGVCQTIRNEDRSVSLLSLPYSYANYYCGVDPWRNNVQSYFDTSSADTVKQIMTGLETHPPVWILYQRQLKFLRGNEIAFNHGRRSAHRELDELIIGNVKRGRWEIVGRWSDQPGNDWQLIRTNAPFKSEG